MILVDTSAWVEFDRATKARSTSVSTGLIAANHDIAVTEPAGESE